MSLPNLITLARLLAVPFAVHLILQTHYHAAFWLFVAAGVSDAVDGFLAKRLKQTSTLGAYLDPLADKALLVAVFLSLGSQGQIETWLVILVVSRDLMIVGGVVFLFLFGQSTRIKPSLVSKANTALQIALAAVVLADLGPGLAIEGATEILTYVVAATTVISGAGYLVEWIRQMSHAETTR